ncbi:MAG: cation:proton antiporter [Acidobacteriota bacterium]|nr:MAG: cation:proton antiporter [Acidobacteriota bacterium]
MIESHAADPALTLAAALAAGMIAQSLARHLRLPGIVLLLGTGVALGPDLLGVVNSPSLGSALPMLVGFAVAVILFEGGMNLSLGRLRREAHTIRRLITWGAIITAVGGALAARVLMGWDWRLSILFGTLVIVTGPTVITPLLRRIRVRHQVATVLEAEGVLIDPIGAIVALVALEVALSPSGASLASGMLSAVTRLGVGVALGVIGGGVIVLLLRARRLVPEGLENVFTLSLVLALFQLSEHLLAESGIATATVAGMVVGNVQTRVTKDLMEFKEQLTVMFIGMLFVLLAADVRLDDVLALSWQGLATVGVLMLLVRPLNVAASTLGSELSWRERGFISWLAPRGIVAAAVASLFAETLADHGISGGESLRALVFLVIAVTVLVQGLTGSAVAHILGLRRPVRRGWAILGANGLGRALARSFREQGEEVLLIDANPEVTHTAQDEGFRIVFGNALEERTLIRADVDSRAGCLAVTPNDEVNLMFADKVREETALPRVFVAIRFGHGSINARMVEALDARVLFAGPQKLAMWVQAFDRDQATVELWERSAKTVEASGEGASEQKAPLHDPRAPALPLLVGRARRWQPVDDRTRIRPGDRLYVAIIDERRSLAEQWLAGRSLRRIVDAAATSERAT